MTAPKEAKNLIVAAASNNVRAGDIDAIAGFSSRGPAVDGRWIPTVAAPGASISSSRSSNSPGNCSIPIGGTNNLNSLCSGTSMAAPHVAGSAAWVADWWRSSPLDGNDDPSPAMVKALLVNSAVDMGTPDRPNIHEGWGRIHLPGLFEAAAPLGAIDQSEILTATGQRFQISVAVVNPSEPLRVTLAWSDAPGAAGANPALVNNLDLSVDTGGDTYLGNQFAAGWSTIGGTADSLNNLENVFVPSPGPSATITIDAIAIAGDGVPYNGDTTDQDFALVCYNCLEQPDFTLDVSPAQVSVCAPDSGVFQVEVGSVLGFIEDVTLGVTGEPAGTTASFGTNPVTPPDTTHLTISGTGGSTPGAYMLEIMGVSTTTPKTRDVDLSVFDVIPATDLDTSTKHYWRVWADNACGMGPVSLTWSFTTVAAPGDCGPGTTPADLFFDDLEGDTSVWTTGGLGSTWQISSANTHSGVAAFWGEDVAQVSDQYLISPLLDLTAAESRTTLQFWNHQTIEDGGSACYDGAVVEISADGGATWTRLEAELQTDPYDGPVDNRFSNPLADENAWCGDPQEWLESVVDIATFTSEPTERTSVQFRFRLATYSSSGRVEGWKIDDILVQTCVASDEIFADGFESGDTNAWSSTTP